MARQKPIHHWSLIINWDLIKEKIVLIEPICDLVIFKDKMEFKINSCIQRRAIFHYNGCKINEMRGEMKEYFTTCFIKISANYAEKK